MNLDPQTDIPELEVVTATDILPEEELHRAITQVLEEAGRQYSAGLLIRMEGSIQEPAFCVPGQCGARTIMKEENALRGGCDSSRPAGHFICPIVGG